MNLKKRLRMFSVRSLLRCMIGVLLVVMMSACDEPVTWDLVYGGDSDDWTADVTQTFDGGYIVAGYTDFYDLQVTKVDPLGMEEWNKTYGGSERDYGFSISRTFDGGYIVSGGTESYGAGGFDAWLIKLAADGTEEWNKTYGGISNDLFFDTRQTLDGGYIAAGYTTPTGADNNDCWIVKLDAAGNEQWSKTYGESGYDSARSIEQTIDGGYMASGLVSVDATGLQKIWVLKLTASGNEVWTKLLGGEGNDYALEARQAFDGGYIVGGVTYGTDIANADGIVIKLDPQGNEVWSKQYGGEERDQLHSIKPTFDGGYVAAGAYGQVNTDVWVLKLDYAGNIVWDQKYDRSHSDLAYSVDTTFDGGYIVAGITDPDEETRPFNFNCWLLKLNSSGEL
ncbi:MAG: hypothetical protein GY754_31595 [bacterium]|nr:hypothetical protein [bacterium]